MQSDPKGRPGAGRGWRTTKVANQAEDEWKSDVEAALDALFNATGTPPIDDGTGATDGGTDTGTGDGTTTPA